VQGEDHGSRRAPGVGGPAEVRRRAVTGARRTASARGTIGSRANAMQVSRAVRVAGRWSWLLPELLEVHPDRRLRRAVRAHRGIVRPGPTKAGSRCTPSTGARSDRAPKHEVSEPLAATYAVRLFTEQVSDPPVAMALHHHPAFHLQSPRPERAIRKLDDMINSSTNLAVEIGEPSGLKRLFASFAPVKRSEIATVVMLTVNVFVLLTCYYVLKVLREPLILLGGGAELKAYASAGQTLLLIGVVPAFGWLSSRVTRLRLLTTMQLIFIGCLLAFYVLAQVRAPIGLAFYLWLGIFNVLVVSNFWSFANDLYTEDQGKRLFAVIGVGASIGAIVGAFVPHLLHRLLGIHALMLVAVGGLGLSIVLYRLVDLRERGHTRRARGATASSTPDAGQGSSRKGGFALVMKDRYLRLLAGMLLVAMTINTTGEYVIGKMATDRSKEYAAEQATASSPPATSGEAATRATGAKSTHEAGADDAARTEYLSRFYSDYYTLVNLLSFLLQALVVARLLTRLGIRRALFIMPLIVLGGWIALFMFANVTMVRVEKTTENSLDYSLHNTLRHALFLPTSRESKYKAKAAIDTFFFRMGDVIAGLGIVFLLVRVLGLGVRAFAVLNIVLAVCWLLLAVRAGRLHDKLAAEQVTTGGRPGAARSGVAG
jgi:AAA family ATP:ADP antiporter